MAVAAAINLLVPIPIAWLIVPIALGILGLQIWGSYKLIASVFKWLCIALFAYIGAGILARWFSAAESAAMAFVLMYAVHLVICYVYLRRRHSFTPGAKTTAVWLSGLAVVVGTSAAAWTLQ